MSNRTPQDIIRKIYADFGRGDIPAILAALSPTVSWTVHGKGHIPYGGSHAGTASVQRWFDTILTGMTITRFDVERFVAQDDTVVCLGQFGCLVKATGKQFATPFAHVWRVRNGTVAVFEDFFDTEAASSAHAG